MSDQKTFPQLIVGVPETELPTYTYANARINPYGGTYSALMGDAGDVAVVENISSDSAIQADPANALLCAAALYYWHNDNSAQTRAVGDQLDTLFANGLAGTESVPVLGALGFVYSSDDAATFPVEGIGSAADNVLPTSYGMLCAAYMYGHDGADGMSRIRTNGATNLSAATQAQAIMSAQPGEWAVNHVPAANTKATITQAAGGAGVRHVCRSITATVVGLAAAAEAVVVVQLRDGATGAGTVLWSTNLLITGTTGSQVGVTLPGLNIVGSDDTAMTLEFVGAGGASTYESVALTGYSTV